MNHTVSFNVEPIVHDTLALDDYSSDERKQAWWDRKELKFIKQENSKTINWIMGGKHGGEDNRFCSRGLEFKTPTKLRDHTRHKKGAIKAVLKVQKDANHELVAKAYETFSSHSSKEAKIMASIE